VCSFFSAETQLSIIPLDGFVIWYKRLEKGTFAKNAAKTGLIERRDFFMLLEGIVPKKIGKRFKFP
jgi:hypothetical protein